jgi:hypothetical protein
MTQRDVINLKVWPRWMSKRMAALYTSYSEKQIDRLIANGSLPFIKLRMNNQKRGCQLRIDRKDLDRLMMENKKDFQQIKKDVLSDI